MSKTALWVIVGLVVLGGGYAIIHSKKDAGVMNPAMSDGTSAPLEATNPNAGKKVAFSQFIKQGGSYKCTVHQSMGDMESTGTVYVSGGKTAGNFTTVAEGKPMTTSFVMKDGYSYTWSSMMAGSGFKMKIATDAANPGAPASGTYSWNADQIGDYDCQAWSATDAQFALPTGVKFQDMSSMQMQAQ